jgi:hypothetical protein
MNLDYLRENLRYRKEIVPTALIGVAVLCGLLILVKVTGFFVVSARAENVVRRAKAQSQADPKVVEAQLARSRPIADQLRTNNLFSPPLPKQHPIKDVYAVFGDEVLINDKWYKVGDRVADAKIVAIGPTSVTTEWDGKKQTFYPIEATIAQASGPGKGPPSPDGKGGEGAGKEGGAASVMVQGEGGPPRFDIRMGPGGPGGMDFGAMRDRFSQMSEAERDRFREEMRQGAERFGFGGRGGPGGERGPGGDRGRGGGR